MGLPSSAEFVEHEQARLQANIHVVRRAVDLILSKRMLILTEAFAQLWILETVR